MSDSISTAPVGPALDADVERCVFEGRRQARDGFLHPYSTSPKWAFQVLECLAIGCTIEIEREYDEADDLAGGTGDRWIVRGDSTDPDDEPYAIEGRGKTLAEAICRAATHMAAA